eukprot:1456850-Ditylum_brightwellii.AAC.1
MSERGLDNNSNTDNLKKAILDVECGIYEEYLACLFILIADDGQYQGLKQARDNQFLMDKN